MIRQRVNLRTPLSAYMVRALTLLLGLALIWYGLMVVLLAVKASPHTINSLSAYRTIYHHLANLRRSDFTTPVQLIAGFTGLIGFLVFIYFAVRQLPRPYLARSELELGEQEPGRTTVKPRAIERVAELAAKGNPNVADVAGRLGDHELNLSIGTRRAGAAAETLRDVRSRVISALERHELPSLPVNVTLTAYDRQTRRELS
ncbi:MAG: hypothetical protein M3022_15245 [Actinomycetota bacterium]|nr:hypothetical protein [Actinomycetota bacterium]